MTDVISNDTLCVKCRYNLRALRLDARCPECGTPVRDSMEKPQQRSHLPLVLVFVGYVAANFALYFHMYLWDRSLLFDVGPTLFLYAPLSTCILVALGRLVGLQFRWLAYVAFATAVGAVGLANLLFYRIATSSV